MYSFGWVNYDQKGLFLYMNLMSVLSLYTLFVADNSANVCIRHTNWNRGNGMKVWKRDNCITL